MDLHKLRCFVAVVDAGNLTKAARVVNMTQPPLSMLIQKLEQEMGAQLFLRRNNRLLITDAGSHLYERARELLSMAATVQTEVSDVQEGKSGNVVIGGTGAASLFILPKVLERIQNERLRIVIQMREGETAFALDEVRNRRVDIAIVRTVVESEDLLLRTLLQEPLVVALHHTHPLAQRDRISLDDLENEHFLVHKASLGAGIATVMIKQCQLMGFTPKIIYRGNETIPMLHMVAAGLGVMLVPASYQRIPTAPNIRFIPTVNDALKASLSVVTHRNGLLSAAGKKVLSLIESELDEMRT